MLKTAFAAAAFATALSLGAADSARPRHRRQWPCPEDCCRLRPMGLPAGRAGSEGMGRTSSPALRLCQTWLGLVQPCLGLV